MKVLCYFVIIVAFLMYYQQNPMYTIVIIGIGIALYIFFKSRKGKPGMLTKFFSGKGANESHDRIDDLILLFMLQQMSHDSRNQPQKKTEDKKQKELELTKQEILDLLEEK